MVNVGEEIPVYVLDVRVLLSPPAARTKRACHDPGRTSREFIQYRAERYDHNEEVKMGLATRAVNYPAVCHADRFHPRNY